MGLSITIQNTGTDTLNITSVQTASGSQDFGFTLPQNSISPGQSTNLAVNFTPSSAGNISDRIIINSDDPDESSYSLVVTAQVSLPPPLGSYRFCFSFATQQCWSLFILDGTPNDGIGYATWAAHQNLQGIAFGMSYGATSVAISGGPSVVTQNMICSDGVARTVQVSWTSELSANLAGGTMSIVENYDYGACLPSASSTTQYTLQQLN